MKSFIFALLFTAVSFSQVPNPNCRFTLQQFLDAIQMVEVGNTNRTGPYPTGDRGRAIGPFQIHEVYWLDSHRSGLPIMGAYADCNTYDYAALVVRHYMLRYSRAEMTRLINGQATWADVERMARIHNGGPRGHTRSSTDRYWTKVEKELRKVCP